MITLKYNYLFMVELLHRYFAGGQCPDVRMVPSAQTARFVRQYKLIVKQYGNCLYAGLPTGTADEAFPVPANGTRFTFFLQLTNPQFYNYTNLSLRHPFGNVYYFTNRVANHTNNKNFLTRPILYDSSATYHPGGLAINSTGTVFQATHSFSGITPPADGAASNDWMQIDKNRYLTEGDTVQWLSPVSTYRFETQQASATIEVSGFNPAAPEAYDAPVLTRTLPFNGPADFFQLDLSALLPGKYKLRVNGKTQFIYVNGEENQAGVFAVLELYQEATLPAGYQLPDTGNALLPPLYTIHFLNRVRPPS